LGRQIAAVADTSASFRRNIQSFVRSRHCFVGGFLESNIPQDQPEQVAAV
jgi:hypothetical protein